MNNKTIWNDYLMRPIAHDGRLICPYCSKTKGIWGSWYTPKELVEPLFLVERLNSKTQQKFFGCPNFPNCKYSYNKPRMIYKEIFDEDEMCCNDFQC